MHLYTDGLVERRDRPVAEGIDLATAQLQGLADDMTGDALVEALVGELVGDVAEDDIALLVVRHRGDRREAPAPGRDDRGPENAAGPDR